MSKDDRKSLKKDFTERFLGSFQAHAAKAAKKWPKARAALKKRYASMTKSYQVTLPEALDISQNLHLTDRSLESFTPMGVCLQTKDELKRMRSLYKHVLKKLPKREIKETSYQWETERITNALDDVIRDGINNGVNPDSIIDHIEQCSFKNLTHKARRCFLVLLRVSLRDLLSSQKESSGPITKDVFLLQHLTKNDDLHRGQLERLFEIAWEFKPEGNAHAEWEKQEDTFVRVADLAGVSLNKRDLREFFEAISVVTRPLAKYDKHAQQSVVRIKKLQTAIKTEENPNRLTSLKTALSRAEARFEKLEQNRFLSQKLIQHMTFKTYNRKVPALKISNNKK